MHRIGNAIVAALLVGSPTVSSAEQSTPKAEAVLRSATKARDIGGFALGMHIRDAAKMAKLESVGGNQFDAEHDGRRINLEVTPLGRIFRVQSSQSLGRFAVDAAFTNALAAKLAAKYGPPKSSDFGSYGWAIVEPVKGDKGRTLPLTTMWMSAYISNGPGISDVSLEMKLIDFRILWEDEVKINHKPGDKAVENIAL